LSGVISIKGKWVVNMNWKWENANPFGKENDYYNMIAEKAVGFSLQMNRQLKVI